MPLNPRSAGYTSVKQTVRQASSGIICRLAERGRAVPIPLPRITSGYLAHPQGSGPHPGVVVIHELLGLTVGMKRIAERFADSGYAALAVDLCPKSNVVICIARLWLEVRDPGKRQGVARDLVDALRWLGTQSGVDPDRLGVIGFCLGGGYALELAGVDRPEGPRAAAVFYGQNPRPVEEMAVACPIVGSYPGVDFTTTGVRKLRGELRARNRRDDCIKIYPRTLHSFMNEGWPVHNKEAADDAWRRTTEFFQKHLAPTSPEVRAPGP